MVNNKMEEKSSLTKEDPTPISMSSMFSGDTKSNKLKSDNKTQNLFLNSFNYKQDEPTTRKKSKAQNLHNRTRLPRNCTQTNKICDYMVNENWTQNSTTAEEVHHGHKYQSKLPQTIRLWYTNPCGIGVDPYAQKSDDSFFFLRNKSKMDIFGLAETNVHWKMLYNNASLYARLKNRWK